MSAPLALPDRALDGGNAILDREIFYGQTDVF